MSVFTDLDEHTRADLDTVLTDVLSAVLAQEAINTRERLPVGPQAVARLAIHDQEHDGYAVVEVRTGVALARVIAARMMSVPSPAPADIVDAVAEIGNMAGGNVKTLLCHHARLSLPTSEITEPAPYGSFDPGEECACVRAVVLGHVAQLVVQPRTGVDGLIWPPTTITDDTSESNP